MECSWLHDNCQKAHGHGVTIKTLYHLAKSAGIDISVKISFVPPVPKVPLKTKSPNPQNGETGDLEDTEEKNLPTIPAGTAFANVNHSRQQQRNRFIPNSE
jgi:hypothetical protein